MDRGSQYASLEYQALLSQHDIRCSIPQGDFRPTGVHSLRGVSRKGNCWNNAVMGRFFLKLKMERV
jgi:putative transposase